jgi:hypothetical protein
MQSAGFKIIPVPVYYPDVTEILGEKVYRKLADIPGEVDMVNVFRRSQDIPPHLEDILAKKPKSVWIQLGISNDEVAEKTRPGWNQGGAGSVPDGGPPAIWILTGSAGALARIEREARINVKDS